VFLCYALIDQSASKGYHYAGQKLPRFMHGKRGRNEAMIDLNPFLVLIHKFEIFSDIRYV
jgi:hypothetical protein